MIQYSKNKPDYTQIKNKLKDSWLNYAVTGEIKKLALTVIAHKSAPEKILQLREIFHDIDIENTGFISREEFEKAFPRSDFSKDDLECIFSSLVSFLCRFKSHLILFSNTYEHNLFILSIFRTMEKMAESITQNF